MLAALFTLLVATTPAPEVAATLTEVTAVATANVPGTEVLSTRDIEKIMELESQKQLVGCNASDCLAELAGALGARLVVFGELGALDDQLVLTLNLYDAESARSVGRQLVQGPGAAELSKALPGAARALLEAQLGSMSSRPVRVLVMNIQATTSTTAAPAPAPHPLQSIGLGVAALGGVAVVVGGVAGYAALTNDGTATAPTTTQVAAKAAYDTRDAEAVLANISFGAAAVLIGGGVALYVLGME